MNRLALVLILAFAAGCARGTAQTREAETPVPVRIAAVATDRVAVPVTATGTLGPKDDVTLSFKVGGVVARILVDEGQTVAAGQLLAALDHGDVDPALVQARAAADKADRDLARARRLYADSVATLEQVQNAETAKAAASAALDAATFNRRHASIVAPAAGVILQRQAEPGELVQAGAPVLTLGSGARGQVVRVALADKDVVRVRRGDKATVAFDALPGRVFEGQVSEIAAAADPSTGTYRVDVSLGALPGAGALASGLVGAVSIRPAADQAVVLVPAVSVLEADGRTGVVYTLAADGRHAVRKTVALAFFDKGRIAVADGLDGARAVITDGAAYLDDGQAVEVRR
ncbi:MAG: efflux RND transporter periplasmic adaptor subunit [Bacteroidota bacterium]